MWRTIGLIGRDRLLEREILPRAKGRKAGFLLQGAQGVGKTAVLEWAFDHAPGPKALISASHTIKENLTRIVSSWGLTVIVEGRPVKPYKATVIQLEQTVNQCSAGWIFVDDIQAATPTFLRRLKVWRERYVIYCAGTPPFGREALKRILWGLKAIDIRPLNKPDRERLARLACTRIGSAQGPRELAHASRGVPARLIAMARGEIEDRTPRAAGEELDLSPVLLLVLAGVMAVRYIGIGLGETDLYLLGGLGMGVAMFVRFWLYRRFSR